MHKPSQVIPSLCEGYVLSKGTKSYSFKDTILYALGVGASQDSTDPEDLKYTYENSEDFSVLPGYATVIPDLFTNFMSLEDCPGMPEFNVMRLLHGEQKITIHKPLPANATVEQTAFIKSVSDKKSGALVVLEIATYDAEDHSPICNNQTSLFIRGIGGFGGTKSSNQENIKFPNRPADFTYTKLTTSDQALIYRLSGDYNPLHVDPNMAAMGGFTRPILHGLCFYGIAIHGIVKLACNNKPEAVKEISARFSSTVTPGDTISTEMWKMNSNTIYFKTTNMNSSKVCISNGVAIINYQSFSKM
uniref:Hydroxysteroid 17-beta dehydrogenase 4 n=1 Tax=Nephromyces sp. MMRI TaxID=2496275 RepID=A0A3S5HLV1_9APIC|nr:hydroxysteroid 17-beta dehydrogenase 4 [Nephromyces sp. MMRI]AZL94358.1 hydroxysteroid 17-beta dehydrogenase 4 [Nephromyces sp. MMRI]